MRISVVLPTCEGASYLEELMPVLMAQHVEGGHEVLVVDSSSEDGSAAICERAGASVTVIPRADFRHGATRNLRAADAQGDFVVFLTQDALPRGQNFLESLVAPLSTGEVVGTWARILPRSDDDALTQRTALSQPEASEVELVVKGDAQWQASSIQQQLAHVHFNNVASAVRGSYFRENPFEDVAFGEDLAWALSALEDGQALQFAPEAVVAHAHRYSLAACFERNRVDAAFQRTRFGHKVRSGIVSVLRGVAFEVREDVRFILGHGPGGGLQLLRSPFLRAAQVFGQLFGSRGWNTPGGDEATRKLS